MELHSQHTQVAVGARKGLEKPPLSVKSTFRKQTKGNGCSCSLSSSSVLRSASSTDIPQMISCWKKTEAVSLEHALVAGFHLRVHQLVEFLRQANGES